MASRVWTFLDEHFENLLCALLLALLVVCLGWQIFVRYVFKAGVTWAEELSRFAFIWTVYFGISLAAKNEQHVRVTAQYLLLPPRLRPWVWLFADGVWVVFNVWFTVQGIGLVAHAFAFPETTPALGWSAAYVYLIIPLGFLMMTVRILQVYARGFRRGTWREIAKIGGTEA